MSQADFEATLSLFNRVVWYTDSDTTSSGALELARRGLDSLLVRGGRLFVSSGLVFGTRSAFGDQEARFRDLFGIDEVFRGSTGSTNFAMSSTDTVTAAVDPGLTKVHFLLLGLRAIMECFASRHDAVTRSLYFYPESTFVRATSDSLHPYVNPVQYDIGVEHELPTGGRTVYALTAPYDGTLGEVLVEYWDNAEVGQSLATYTVKGQPAADASAGAMSSNSCPRAVSASHIFMAWMEFAVSDGMRELVIAAILMRAAPACAAQPCRARQ